MLGMSLLHILETKLRDNISKRLSYSYIEHLCLLCMFDEEQLSVLADMLQAAVMLKYNKRRVG